MVSVLRRAFARGILPAFVALALPGLAAAQGGAVLTGKIVDSAGAPIRGASLRIPQLERSVTVDSSGTYRVEGLPTGRVTVVGEAPGFAGKRAEVIIPANGSIEQAFSLVPNARVLANVEVRARARPQVPLKLHEFEMRRRSSMAGRYLGPDDMVKFSGRPLVDALKTVMVGVRFQRTATGEMNIVSQRSLNPASIRQSSNTKPCGVQIWQDGQLLSDPNQSLELMSEHAGATAAGTVYPTTRVGADHDYDISNLLSNDYMAAEYYSDLSGTPPGFRTGTPSCGTLVLWTKDITARPTQAAQQQPAAQPTQ
jgi:hypothetical protein